MKSSSTTQDPSIAFDALPGSVKAFLVSTDTGATFKKLVAQLSVTDATLGAVVDLVGDIDLGFLALSDLVTRLTELGISREVATRFSSDLAGYRYLPIARFVGGNVSSLIEAWGGDPKKYPLTTIEVNETTPESIADEIVKESRIDFPPRIADRFRHVFLSRVNGVRTDTEFKDILTRAEKVGGLGLTPNDAERIIGILRLKLASTKIIKSNSTILPPSPFPLPSEGEGMIRRLSSPSRGEDRMTEVRVTTRPTAGEALPAAARFIQTSPSRLLPPAHDEAEIALIKTELEKKLTPASSSRDHKITESIGSILNASKINFSTPELKTRFENIVRMRLRDIRGADETHTLLTLPQNQSGLGLPNSAADKIGKLIEAEVAALTGALRAEKKREDEGTTRIATRGAQNKANDAHAQELKALEERFITLAGKSKQLKEREVLLPPLPQNPKSVFRNPKPAPEMKPVLSPSSIAPQVGGKPRVEDVKFTQKLTGPVEELRAMTIVEFRRLSKDAKEATLKVRDQIDLVKDQGHEKYVAAVHAWKESEPSRLYLELSRTALEKGTPIPAIITERARQNEPTLTVAEFQAILSLNSGLRF